MSSHGATVSESQSVHLAAVHKTFRRWLGDSYDLDALDAVLAAAAVRSIDGDPVWLLVISGAGNAKTETVATLAGLTRTFITSTITSEGALLSATPAKETGPKATGGLLRRLGDNGLLVLKDFTTILSMSRDSRAAVLAALREIYDGKWERNVGTDGGRSISWEGRLVLVGAVTSAYDAAHSVIAAMGDRFALVRMDSADPDGRRSSGMQALANVGKEVLMRKELSACITELFEHQRPAESVGDDVMSELLDIADLVTLSRTAVERDFQGNILDAHAPEAPTRFAKQLAQIMRGAAAIGASTDDALRTALRVARDTIPPSRLAALLAVQQHPGSTAPQLAGYAQKPQRSMYRALDELEALRLISKEASTYSIRGTLAEQVLKAIADVIADA